MQHRKIRIVLAAFLALLVFGTAVTYVWFIRPLRPLPAGEADAVIMFGGAGERFERAKELVEEQHLAPLLVISDPTTATARPPAFEWFCDGRNAPGGTSQPRTYESLCIDPTPDTTYGEALAVARLARERGWRRVILVTTTEQGRRARWITQRCLSNANGEPDKGVRVDVVTVATDLNRVLRIGYEWAATVGYLVIHRSC